MDSNFAKLKEILEKCDEAIKPILPKGFHIVLLGAFNPPSGPFVQGTYSRSLPQDINAIVTCAYMDLERQKKIN